MMSSQDSNSSKKISSSSCCCVPEGEIPDYCVKASEQAADKSVKKVFAILGVDVDQPESVENFRKDLRFGGRMRKYVDHGTLVFVGAVALAITYALLEGLLMKIKAGL